MTIAIHIAIVIGAVGLWLAVSYGVGRIARSEAAESERDWPYGDVVQVPKVLHRDEVTR